MELVSRCQETATTLSQLREARYIHEQRTKPVPEKRAKKERRKIREAKMEIERASSPEFENDIVEDLLKKEVEDMDGGMEPMVSAPSTPLPVVKEEEEPPEERLASPLYDEEVVEGFSFCSFNLFEDLEVFYFIFFYYFSIFHTLLFTTHQVVIEWL